jgi:hypothetical protein
MWNRLNGCFWWFIKIYFINVLPYTLSMNNFCVMFSYLWKSICKHRRLDGVFVFNFRVLLHNETCKGVKIWVKPDILPMVCYTMIQPKKGLYFKPNMFDIFYIWYHGCRWRNERGGEMEEGRCHGGVWVARHGGRVLPRCAHSMARLPKRPEPLR